MKSALKRLVLAGVFAGAPLSLAVAQTTGTGVPSQAYPQPGTPSTPQDVGQTPQTYSAPSYPQAAPSGGGMTDNGTRPGHEIGVGESLPSSTHASNINSGDTNPASSIAPSLPAPNVGPDANVGELLTAANQALAANQTGTAEEAMERAETLILTRSVPQSEGDQASMNPVVNQVEQARQALGAHDTAGAQQILTQVLNSNAPALAD
jgi:hypothetical protein